MREAMAAVARQSASRYVFDPSDESTTPMSVSARVLFSHQKFSMEGV